VIVCRSVLFCGDKTTSASEVGSCVIAAAAMMAPALSGVMRRAYPYACLTQLDFLSLPGYTACCVETSTLCLSSRVCGVCHRFIAGVTNPMFATKPQWWDVMANVATGRGRAVIIVLAVVLCVVTTSSMRTWQSGEVTTAEQALAASTSSSSSPALPPGLATVALYSPGDLPAWKPLDEIVFEKV
jgi:hypothetical protein